MSASAIWEVFEAEIAAAEEDNESSGFVAWLERLRDEVVLAAGEDAR